MAKRQCSLLRCRVRDAKIGVGFLEKSDICDLVGAKDKIDGWIDVRHRIDNKNVYRNDLVKVYPNPFSDQALVELDINTISEVNIRLINSMGQVIVERTYGSLSGKNVLPIDGTNLSDGIYMIHITMDDVLITKRVIFSKQ